MVFSLSWIMLKEKVKILSILYKKHVLVHDASKWLETAFHMFCKLCQKSFLGSKEAEFCFMKFDSICRANAAKVFSFLGDFFLNPWNNFCILFLSIRIFIPRNIFSLVFLQNCWNIFFIFCFQSGFYAQKYFFSIFCLFKMLEIVFSIFFFSKSLKHSFYFLV